MARALPVPDYPRTFMQWGNNEVDAQYDMTCAHASAGNTTQLQSAKLANPNMIALMTANGSNPIAPCHVTYGGGSYDQLASPITDTLTQTGPYGTAANVGTVRAFSSFWDYLYKSNGSRAPIIYWNLANEPYNRGGITPTWDNIARFIVYRCKQNSIYSAVASNGVPCWDGYHSDNWVNQLISGNYAGSDVDTDRNGVIDNGTTATNNFTNGINQMGKYLRDHLPGLIIGGNQVWGSDPRQGTWAQYGTDHDGWHKYANWAQLEIGHLFLYSDAQMQKLIDIATSTDSSIDGTVGCSRLGWLNYPDPYGLQRYFLFMFELHNDSQVTIAKPANYNTESVYTNETYYKPARKCIAAGTIAGAFVWPLFTQEHNSRMWFRDEYRGGALNARGWMGQPIAAAQHPVTGVFYREFQRGLAVVNVSGASQTFNLPGGANVWRRIDGAFRTTNPGGATLNDGSVLSSSTLSIPAHDGRLFVRIGSAPPPTIDPPSNITLPTITGIAQENELLTPTAGTWANGPSIYTYRWWHYTADGLTRITDGPYTGGAMYDETIPSNATPSQYTTIFQDVGDTLRLEVVATNAAGSASALSAATPVIVSSGGGNIGDWERYDGPAAGIFDFTMSATVTFPPSPIFDFTITKVGVPAVLRVRISGVSQKVTPSAQPAVDFPTVTHEIAFTTNPLAAPTYTDTSTYLRRFSTSRGRSFEYDRMEAGTSQYVLANRDSRFNPDNTSGPYYPNLKPNRRVRIRATWSTTVYPLIVAFTQGYPQDFVSGGYDAMVQQSATDWFFPLNQIKFPKTQTFPQQTTGQRIADCLDLAGVPASDRNINTGQSTVVAVTVDANEESSLSGVSLLEHILLMAETENGRFFAAKDGVLTFLERHTLLRTELTSRGIFGDGGGSEIPYAADPAPDVQQDESKIFNVVRITTGNDTTVEARDQTSIDTYFERTLEKTWPLASDLEAQDAANYMLYRLKDPQLRIGELRLTPLSKPTTIWPVALSLEIGQKYTFRLRPRGGGTTIEKESIIDGVGHDVAPRRWNTKVKLVPSDKNAYWILGQTGYGELDTTSRIAY